MTALIKKIFIKNPASISLRRIIALLIALIVFSYMIYRASFGVRDIIASGIHFKSSYLLLSFACQMIGVAIATIVWSSIIHRLAIRSSYLFDFEAFCTSAIARKIPGTAWYAIGRIILYNHRYKVSKTLLMIGIMIEAIMISLGGLMALGISLALGFTEIPFVNNQLFLYIIIPVLIIFTSLAGPRIIQFVIRRTYKKINYGEIPVIKAWDTIRWLIGETIVAFFAAGVGYFIFRSISGDISIPFTSISGALSLAITLGPIAMWLPGDIGLKDGFLYLALSGTTGGSFAALVTLTWRIWITLLELLLGGLTLLTLNHNLKLFEKSAVER